MQTYIYLTLQATCAEQVCQVLIRTRSMPASLLTISQSPPLVGEQPGSCPKGWCMMSRARGHLIRRSDQQAVVPGGLAPPGWAAADQARSGAELLIGQGRAAGRARW